MWKTAFRMVRSRYPGRSDLLPKAKPVMNKLGAGDLLSREKLQFAHRPRTDIDAKIFETIAEIQRQARIQSFLHTRKDIMKSSTWQWSRNRLRQIKTFQQEVYVNSTF